MFMLHDHAWFFETLLPQLLLQIPPSLPWKVFDFMVSPIHHLAFLHDINQPSSASACSSKVVACSTALPVFVSAAVTSISFTSRHAGRKRSVSGRPSSIRSSASPSVRTTLGNPQRCVLKGRAS